MLTGGIDIANLKCYINAGAWAIGMGSCLFNIKELQTSHSLGNYIDSLEAQLLAFEHLVV